MCAISLGVLLSTTLTLGCGSGSGGGGGSTDDVAAALDGLRWEIPCVTNTTATLCTVHLAH
jgi:hypothetical protein